MTTPVFGDISSNNAEFHAPTYRASGHIIIAIKATEGVGYVDPPHHAWTIEAEREHLAIIHYHFGRPDLGTTPAAEAHHFLSVALPLADGRAYLALDLERATPAGYQHDPAWSRGFEAYVREHSRFTILLYANRSTLELSDEWLTGEPKRVWDADFGPAPDFAPKGYECVIRQRTDVGSLPGIGPCDIDIARGQFYTQIIDRQPHR